MDAMNNLPARTAGHQLVEDFKTVFLALVTADAAQQQAAASEQSITNYLSAVNNGSFLNPANISQDAQQTITRASLDAHVKKVQADQITSVSNAQVADLMARDNKIYSGRRIEVYINQPALQPVAAVWLDQQYGYREAAPKNLKVAGTIHEISLEKNMILIQPTRRARILNSSLQLYRVFVINPADLEPMVAIDLPAGHYF